MPTILINGVQLEVDELVCEPLPPSGSHITLLVRTGRAPDFRLEREATVLFDVGGGLAYRGVFRLVACQLGPGFGELRYLSTGQVSVEARQFKLSGQLF
jgi:hypothetical protein